MEQLQRKEEEWQLEEEADLRPRQSHRHHLNNHAAIIESKPPSIGNGSDPGNNGVAKAPSSIQSMTANGARSVTSSFEEKEEDTDREDASKDRTREEVDNEYDNEAASEASSESPEARENWEPIKSDNGVYFNNSQGTDQIHEFSGIRSNGHEYSDFGTKLGDEGLNIIVEDSDFQKGPDTQANSQYGENLKDKTFSGSCLSLAEKSPEVQNTNIKLINNEVEVEVGADIAEEIGRQVMDLDVEAVLEKQETHDLFCPNCNSCITRRVILRRRKGKFRNLRPKPKHEKPEIVPDTELPINPPNDPIPADDTNDSQPKPDDREVDVFRCLSCFSIFIPSGDGFNIFRNFGDSHGKENMQNPQKMSASSTNWFFSVFAPKKGKMTDEQENNNIGSQQDGLKPPVPSTGESLPPEKSEIKIDRTSSEALGNESVDDQNHLASSSHVAQPSCSIGLGDGVVIEQRENPREIVDCSTPDDTLHESTVTDVKEKLDDSIEKGKTDGAKLKQPEADTAERLDSSFVLDAYPPQRVGDRSATLVTGKLADSVLPAEDSSSDPQKGKEVVVTVEDEREELVAEPLPSSGSLMNVGRQVGEVHEWDILKSIVYGGLIESITSLSVVSSAAGAGAAPLIVLALGLANLVGGLFIIVHNLLELRYNAYRGASDQASLQDDRYQELLGRMANFKLHAVVAVLSYLIFGLVSPVLYAVFYYREFENREYSVAAVVAASLVCIILLAVGKARTGKPPKTYFRTVIIYVAMALLASGVSCVIGDLIEELLEKTSWFESSLLISMPLSEKRPAVPGWASH